MDPSHPLITIVGSLSFDLTSYTSRLPTAGETLTSTAFSTGCGGKGSNQAVATARMAQGNKLRVSMIGCVGDDTFGQTLRSGLGDEGIDVTHLRTIHGQTSGVANIIVEEATGENRILIHPGANASLLPEAIPTELFESPPRLIILQLECPLQTVLHVIKEASSQHPPIPVLLNPAPAVDLPEWTYGVVEILVLNETEAAMLSGLPLVFTSEKETQDSALTVARSFRKKGCAVVIVTLGAYGAVFASEEEEGWVPADKVSVGDTTGAGDTFIGAFAVEWVLGEGKSRRLADCVAFANRAAAWSVGRRGTWNAVPKRADLA